MRRAPVIALVLMVLAVAACGSDDDTVDAGDDPGASVEGEWVAVDITEDGEARPLVEGTELILTLTDGQLGASAGCNSMGGRYELVDGELRVDGLSMTEMGCDPPRHEQDEWLADLVTSGPTVESVAQGLVLRLGSTVVEFVDRSVVEPDVDLVGTTWEVTGFISGSGPEDTVSDAGGLDAHMVFGADGTVAGFDGCDGFTIGRDDDEPGYALEGDAIVFKARLVGESSACPDIRDLVEAFRAVLGGTVNWDIERDGLTLTAEDGRGVTYRAAQE